MRTLVTELILGTLLLLGIELAPLEAAGPDGPKNATILVIRHAEKAEDGVGLSPAGEERARAYIQFFRELTIQAQPARLARLVATADSNNSRRPRLTLEPLGKALGLPVEARFKNKDYLAMTDSLRAGGSDGKTTLVCWHHGDLPELLRALGADPDAVLPGGRWPAEEYDWLIVLRYDAQGHLQSAPQKVDEHLTATARAEGVPGR